MRENYATALIDGSGFAKAAFAPGKRALCHRFLGRVFKLNREHPGITQVVAWDPMDNASGRCARFPSYKESRRLVREDGSVSRFDSPEYRREMAELRRLLGPLGVHQAWAPGWEADDVLGTLARSAPGRVLVLTRDRDLLQLVCERVHVLIKVGSREVHADPTGVEKLLGFPAARLKDWKALAGDGGDDVPGITGIGEKSASELLEWRSTVVEEIVNRTLPHALEQVHDLSGRGKRALALAQRDPDRLGLMRWLVQLHDVPVKVRRGRLDLTEAREEFLRAGLKKLGDRLGEWR